MAIPYLDFNKQGNGYYTIEQRKFSYLIFQFGFLEMWVTLIILGTFFRGPNWNIFGPFEYWDPHKVLALNNVDLSQYFWIIRHGTRPAQGAARRAASGRRSPTSSCASRRASFCWRCTSSRLPPLMAMTIFRKFFREDGLHALHADVQPAAVHGDAAASRWCCAGR